MPLEDKNHEVLARFNDQIESEKVRNACNILGNLLRVAWWAVAAFLWRGTLTRVTFAYTDLGSGVNVSQAASEMRADYGDSLEVFTQSIATLPSCYRETLTECPDLVDGDFAMFYERSAALFSKPRYSMAIARKKIR